MYSISKYKIFITFWKMMIILMIIYFQFRKLYSLFLLNNVVETIINYFYKVIWTLLLFFNDLILIYWIIKRCLNMFFNMYVRDNKTYYWNKKFIDKINKYILIFETYSRNQRRHIRVRDCFSCNRWRKNYFKQIFLRLF